MCVGGGGVRKGCGTDSCMGLPASLFWPVLGGANFVAFASFKIYFLKLLLFRGICDSDFFFLELTINCS